MPLYNISTLTPQAEINDLKLDVENFIRDGQNYVADFYKEKPNEDILNLERNIVIEGEYLVTGSVLLPITEEFNNFRFRNFNYDRLLTYWWAVISLENA